MSTTKFAIKITNLSKRFGRHEVLREVNLKVHPGEIFGFLGPNGAGKTTTISCLMDFIRPTSGTVTILGLDAHKASTQLKHQIGYLPSDPQLYDNLTGRQHIQLYEAASRPSGAAAKLADRLGLDLTTKAKVLSTGNKQKLSLILAFSAEPKLLILDEPTKGLDPLLQNQLYGLLGEFREGGGTVFVSSHNLAEVQKICDRVGVIRDGRLVASETMDHMRDLAIHEVTAEFATPYREADFRLPGIELVAKTDRTLVLRVHGDLNQLLARLARHPVKDLQINHASLEEVFMRYYSEDK